MTMYPVTDTVIPHGTNGVHGIVNGKDATISNIPNTPTPTRYGDTGGPNPGKRLPTPSKVAYLGPQGTYSHQIARDWFGDSVEYVEKRTIADAFDSVSPDVPFAVIPQENSIFGSVIETYNLLRLPEVGAQKLIRGEITLGINHCLLVRRGVRLEDIKRVLSHEQALGQCTRFLTTKLPGVEQVKVASTAAAAQAVSTDSSSQPHEGESAAICSKVCAQIFPGLQVLEEGIQNENANFTRFFAISHGSDIDLPKDFPSRPNVPPRALIRMFAGSHGQGYATRDRSGIARLLDCLGLDVLRIDRRPSLDRTPFRDVYFAEVQDEIVDGVVSRDDHLGGWTNRVQGAVDNVINAGGTAQVIGIW